MDSAKVHRVWLEAAELVKDRVVSPTVFKALERGVGVALDGDEFVVGYETGDLPLAANLRSAQHHTIIEQCLKEVLKKPVRFRLIEGTSVDDYQRYKKSVETVEQQRMESEERRNQDRKVEQTWEEISERIARSYSNTPFRTYAQQRAVFMNEAFGIINEGITRLKYNNDSTELEKRCLARVFDKLSTLSEVPPAMLAYEFFRLREDGKLK
jgi:hypothetical protein